MKTNRKVHKRIFHFTIALIFIIGFSCPSSISLAQEEEVDDVGHSGGFIVKSEKIEGVMDAFEIMQGNVDIPEGQITGLTITKILTETEHGTLVINIKSPGPVPLDDLRAKSIGLPFFASLCESEQEEWLCMEGVEMTLSEQSVNSIALPNATVETCYEGQCEDDKEEEIEEMSIMLDESKSVEDIEHDLNSVNAMMHVVEEQIERAEETDQAITDDEQEERVKQSLENFDINEIELDELEVIANDIHNNYSTFNKHVSQLALTTAVVDDILKHMLLILEQDEKEMTRLENEIDEANEAISEQKQTQQTQEALAENEELAKSISNLKELMMEIKDKIDKHQRALHPLEKSSEILTEKLTQYYEKIQLKAEKVDKLEERDDKQIRKALDVAEPGKDLEKQLSDMMQQMDDTDLVNLTTKHDQYIKEASEQAKSSVLSVPLAKQIGQLDARIEENINEESAAWDEQSDQLSELERKFEELVSLIQLPETLFLEYKLNVLLEEKHDYRVEMFTNISQWQQFLSDLKEKQEQIKNALEQHELNQTSLDKLAEVIIKYKQRYTAAELTTIAQHLNIGTQLARERKLSELIENGNHVVNSVTPIIDTASSHIEQLEAILPGLVNKVMVVNLLQEDSLVEFKDAFAKFEQSVMKLERPVKQLNNHLAIAEDLLGDQAPEHQELQKMYATMDTVTDIMNRLEVLIEELDTLPYFSKIKDVVKEMQAVQTQLESVLQ